MLLLGLGAPLGSLFELLLPLAACAIAGAYLFSLYLYIRSFWVPSHALALGGNTGESGGSNPTLKYYFETGDAFAGLFYCLLNNVGIPGGIYLTASSEHSFQ